MLGLIIFSIIFYILVSYILFFYLFCDRSFQYYFKQLSHEIILKVSWFKIKYLSDFEPTRRKRIVKINYTYPFP